MPTLPYTPQPTPDAVMRSIMARYHADMEAQVEHTLADLQYRWRGVAANLANTISQLESKMAAAERAGQTIDYAWLSQERRLLDLKAAVEGDITKYAQGAKAIIGDAQVAAVASGSESALAALQATEPPGLGYTWGVPPEGVLHQIAGATQPYSPLSQLFDEFGPQASAAAQQALFQSVALGEGAQMAAQRLVYATNMSAQRAEVIARTEIMRSWRHAQMANYQANSDVVSGWIWNCDISPRSCPACLSMDGSIHGLDEELDDHVCGRCSAQPITRPWSEVLAGTGVSDAELASLDEMEADSMPARETGADWLARQEPTIQNRIMGISRAEAYRRGDVTLAQLTGITHDPLWGSSIQTRSLRELGLDAQKYLQLARDGGRASVLADAATLARAAEGTPQQLYREWAAAHNIPDITTAGEGRAATPEEIAAATKRQAEAYREWQRSLASNLPREEGETAFAPLSTPGGHGEVRVYDLTAADRAFLNELRGAVPEGGVTSVDEALALGQPLAERINAATADLRAYAEEERLIYQMAPNLTDAQRAWAMGEREATAAHGGVSWTKAAQEFQAAYQAQVRAYLSAFRETGGVELNMATDAEGFDALVATRLDAASQMLPADWLQASNDLGELSVERSLLRDSSGWYSGRFSGDGTLAMNHNKASDLASLESTALHELTHRMEQVIPQLSDLETEFYTARTAGEEFVALTNGIKQETKLDEWLDQYLGREPLNVGRPPILQSDGTYRYATKSYELMTMGVEMALAPGASASTFALQADSEYEAFVLGALMGVRAPVAEAVTTAAEDEAAAAVRATENEIAYAARRAAGTALSDAERSAIQDAVSAGDLPKSYGKYTSVEQLVKTAKGREWYAANATIKAEVKAAEEAATAARTVLTDAERQALKDAVASGDLPKSYGKYSTVEQLTKTARGRAWYEANAAIKAEETAAQTATAAEADAALAAASATTDAAEATLAPIPFSKDLPFDLQQLDAALSSPDAIRLRGMNGAHLVTIDDHQFVIKRMTNEDAFGDVRSGNALQQVRAEVASTEIAQALGMEQYVTPTWSFVRDGEQYAASAFVPDTSIIVDTDRSVVLGMADAQYSDVTLLNFVLGEQDANSANLLVDASGDRLVTIDHSGALVKRDVMPLGGASVDYWHMALLQEPKFEVMMRDFTAYSQMFFDTTRIQTIIDAEPQLLAVLRANGLKSSMRQLEKRINILRRMLILPQQPPSYADLFEMVKGFRIDGQ